jgi:hypothetical protein
MEPPYRRRGYMGKRRRVEGRVSMCSLLICPNLGDEIDFKGGRFVTS